MSESGRFPEVIDLLSDKDGDAVKSNQEEITASRDNNGDAKQGLMELLQGYGTEEESEESAIESDDHNSDHKGDNRSRNSGYNGDSDEEVKALQGFDGANTFLYLLQPGEAQQHRAWPPPPTQ